MALFTMKRIIITGVLSALAGLLIGYESRKHSAVREVRDEFLGRQTIDLSSINLCENDGPMIFPELVAVRQEIDGKQVFDKRTDVNPNPKVRATIRGHVNGRPVMMTLQW